MICYVLLPLSGESEDEYNNVNDEHLLAPLWRFFVISGTVIQLFFLTYLFMYLFTYFPTYLFTYLFVTDV